MEKINTNRKNAFERKMAKLDLSQAQKKRVEELMAESIAFMPDDRFNKTSVMNPIMEEEIEVLPGNSLDDQQEKTLFLQLNYARHSFCMLRRKLLRLAQWKKSDVLKLIKLNELQLDFRSKIVTGNMGLVLAMAKKVDYPAVDFPELVSEGCMALLRATEKFDCARGIKFSTYACRAILKGFSRAAKQNYRYRALFSTQLENSMEKDDFIEQKRGQDHDDWVEEVRAIVENNLAGLSETEMSVVKLRFSIDSDIPEPLTLKQVGEQLGLTKERIRQIQNNALDKLRLIAQDRMTFA